jgi:hypothetical protein
MTNLCGTTLCARVATEDGAGRPSATCGWPARPTPRSSCRPPPEHHNEAYLSTTFIEAEADDRDQVLGLLVRCVVHYMGKPWNGFPIGSLSPAEPSSGCSGPCDDEVFSLNSSTDDDPDLLDIQYTPRFGYVPQIVDFPNGTSQLRRLLRFRPIFMHRLLIENGPVIWDPGVEPAPPTTASISA